MEPYRGTNGSFGTTASQTPENSQPLTLENTALKGPSFY
jgi:hypothetical protein